MASTKNDLNAAVPKFCLAVEEYRRTSEGRVRTTQEFQQHFFPYDDKEAKDGIFKHVPNDVRGPILSQWGIRGLKAALRDTDEKVQSVVHDALVAGDIDHGAFESGLSADVVVRWVPLTSWWSFWRGGKLSKKAIGKALETAYELALFDAKWFFDTVEGRGGKLRGTDVIAEGLTKADLTEWVKKIHAGGDGSPKGLLAALGWEKIVSQTANDVLIQAMDALATKVGLASVVNGATTAEKPVFAKTQPESKRPSDAPDISVGEAEMGSLTEEGMIVDVDDEAKSDPGRDTPVPGSRNSAEPIDLRVLVEDDEDNQDTAVFSLDTSVTAPTAKR